MKTKLALTLFALLMLLFAGPGSGIAQADMLINRTYSSDATYAIDWWTVDSGGGTSNGGVYSLNGTIGQAEPGAQQGGNYSLAGGFWAGLQAALERLFLPFVIK